MDSVLEVLQAKLAQLKNPTPNHSDSLRLAANYLQKGFKPIALKQLATLSQIMENSLQNGTSAEIETNTLNLAKWCFLAKGLFFTKDLTKPELTTQNVLRTISDGIPQDLPEQYQSHCTKKFECVFNNREPTFLNQYSDSELFEQLGKAPDQKTKAEAFAKHQCLSQN